MRHTVAPTSLGVDHYGDPLKRGVLALEVGVDRVAGCSDSQLYEL